MRESYQKLQRICEGTVKDDKNFYSLFESTHWLTFVKLLITSSIKIAQIVDQDGSSVLLHCSDGWFTLPPLFPLIIFIIISNYYL